MSTKIGHFEILSELAKSATGTVYKANDPESGQTVALKAIQLSAFGDNAGPLLQALLTEAETTKVLSSSNITKVFGAGEIEGQFCAAMEYIQGNSIATMLQRNEGFSIWDLLDIGRQLSGGLDHAAKQNIVHYSLEPSKIMCGWDGTVKILGFGVSCVGNFIQHAGGDLSSILYYMSPEQIRGDATDGRSNLFSLGAIFYEMVTERKAFDREDAESLRQSILESTPVAPVHVNPKVHPLLSDLIMKALAKDPAQRYQNGRELLDDLEKCKESKPTAKKAEAPKGLVAPDKARTAAQSKFAAAAPPKSPSPTRTPVPAPKPPATASAVSAAPATPATSVANPSRLAVPKAAAAAAGVGGISGLEVYSEAPEVSSEAANPIVDEAEQPTAQMSSAVTEEPPVETFEPEPAADAPNFAVDPTMAEGAAPNSGGGTSFSDISELPPLKEVYIAPAPPPAPVEAPVAVNTMQAAPAFRPPRSTEEKPKIQAREVAGKAIKEIKGVPPKLMMYALGGAAALILVIAIGFTIYVHTLGSDDDAGAARSSVASSPDTSSQPEAAQPAPRQAAPAPVESKPAEVPEPVEARPEAVAPARPRNSRKKAAAPTVIPGQIAVDSTPQGAQVQIDGQTDGSWVTPFVLTNLEPGQHSVTVSKPGYSTDTRTVEVTAGNRASTAVKLTQLLATLIVKSDPPGANIYVDGHDVGAKTPAQVSVNKGQHMVLVRMSGYLDETMSTQFVLGQTFNFAPTLRLLGNADSIKTIGKMSRLFGGKGGQSGEATVSIHTQPKGAQISFNQHMLDKNSPVDVMVDPGNYVIDITMTGYAPIHKVISADRGSKIAVDEVLQPQ